MSDTRCPSMFLNTRCQAPRRHDGTHRNRHTSGHITIWTDQSADPTPQETK